MKRSWHPAAWFPAALLLLTAGGSLVLHQDACLGLSERDRHSYGLRPRWQTAFDALSAVAGVGLLTYDLDEDYTARGRWILAGLGVIGAGLYLTAARQTLARRWPSSAPPLPRVRRVLAAFAIWLGGAALAAVVIEQAMGGLRAADAAWNAVGAFASLGWLRGPPADRHDERYAAIAFIGALGWPVWLLGWQQAIRLRRLLLIAAGFGLFLVLCAILIAALEVPRGAPRGESAPEPRLAGQPPVTRAARALTQVAAASGAGLPIERVGDRRVSEGTKLVLAGVVAVGGLGGNSGGGLKWMMLLTVLAAWRAGVGSGSGPSAGHGVSRGLVASTTLAGLLAGLIVVVALGLLLIEARIGSPYQSPPTLADALLDASSATCGAGLTSGLTATVTGVNLSSGIRQSVDVYQYGMAWLMAAMFIGRLLPLLVLGQAAAAGDADEGQQPALI